MSKASTRILIMAGFMCLACSAQASEPAATVYSGMCDASAAVALDAGHFVVADDERNTLEIYQFGKPQPTSVPIDAFLGTDADKESDLEGAAALGDKIYWISSHSRNKNGEEKPRRNRFFVTDILLKENGATVKTAGVPIKNLLDAMLADQNLSSLGLAAAAKIGPELPKGLNIEGLAASPAGELWIGFRNPLIEGKALLIRMDNPAEVIAGAKPKFGATQTLDLGGRGIRSIERIDDAYLIIAGAIDDKKNFALYRWQGPGGSLKPVEGAPSFSNLNPEAIFARPPGTSHLVVLSDDGGLAMAGGECKKQPRASQHFRAVEFSL